MDALREVTKCPISLLCLNALKNYRGDVLLRYCMYTYVLSLLNMILSWYSSKIPGRKQKSSNKLYKLVYAIELLYQWGKYLSKFQREI
jgi:hypothetical protein